MIVNVNQLKSVMDGRHSARDHGQIAKFKQDMARRPDGHGQAPQRLISEHDYGTWSGQRSGETQSLEYGKQAGAWPTLWP